MELQLEDRQCRVCPRTFKVTANDTRNFHCGTFCRDKDPETDKSQWRKKLNPTCRQAQAIAESRKKAREEQTAKSGAVVHGEVKRASPNEEKKSGNTGNVRELRTGSGSTKGNDEKSSQMLKNETAPALAGTITLTEKSETRPGKNNEEGKEMNTTPIKETTTAETTTVVSKSYEKESSDETPLLDLKGFYGELELEKQSSVKLLSDSAEQLISLGEGLLKERKDESGEVIRKPMNHDVDTALKAFEGARNMLKTKLDYLRLGKDIIKDVRGKQ